MTRLHEDGSRAGAAGGAGGGEGEGREGEDRRRDGRGVGPAEARVHDDHVGAWMQRDPVEIARRTLIDWGVLDAPGADALEEAVKAEVAAAFAWAAEQPLCRPEDGLKHVFAEGEVLPRQIA